MVKQMGFKFRKGKSIFNWREPEESLLCRAIYNRDLPAVATLLAAGADPNGTAINGMTMLMCAAYMNEVESARLLLDNGAQVNATVRDGTTALHYTQESLRGNVEVLRLLLDRGADVNAATDSGYTAFVSAVHSLYKVEAVRILLAAGADVHYQWGIFLMLDWALEASKGLETETTALLRQAGARSLRKPW
jgi:ankyrin repeat protein